MAAAKLGWHFQQIPGWATAVANSAWVKIIDPPTYDPFPICRTIGRVYIPDNDSNALILQGAAGADEWFRRCKPYYDRSTWVYCWEGPNEPPVAASSERAALVTFTRRWVQLMHAAGLRTVALCLSTGWPDIGQAPELAGALVDTDYWAVHEYSAPSMQSGSSWYCLRYRRSVEELRAIGSRIPPLLITECGLDGGVVGQPRRGWKTFTDRPGYLSQLIWYDGELARDDYVAGATIFTSGPNGDWVDFDVDESLSRDLADYIRQQGAVIEPPPTPEPGAPDLRLARPLPADSGWVSQWFGEIVDRDYPEANLAGHNGLDYAAASGTAVLAAQNGTCELGNDPGGYGVYVRITATDSSSSTFYAHLRDASISNGQAVQAGATIGHLGSSGMSAAPHLHFGWKVTGVRNPAYGDWLDPYLGRRLAGAP